MRLQKIILGILLALTCLTIFARGQEIIGDALESPTTPLSSTESIETKTIPIDPLFEFGTGEVIGTGWNVEQLSGTTATTGQELTGDSLLSGELISSGSIFTGEQTGGDQIIIPNLIISEVYYDGTDEWIEISNLSNSSFSGTIQITGSLSLTTYISFAPKQSIILLKPSGSYTRIDLSVPRVTTSTFGFTDTKAITLTLSTSGQMLDIFAVETGRVTKLDNKKTSFEKRLISNEQIITGVTNPVHVLDGYIANPGFLRIENPSETETGTVVDTTGQLISGEETFPPTGPLKITEIGDKNGPFSQFIEIQATQDREGAFILSGSLIKESFFLDQKLTKGDLLIIATSANGWLSNQNSIENTRLDLQESGFLSIYGQSRQVFDTIHILSAYTGKSLYYGGISQSGVRIFDKIDMFSPGFDESLWWYFSAINSGISTNPSVTPPPTPNITTGELSTTVQIPEPGLVQIQSLIFKTPESITITSLRTGIIDLSDHKWYLLTRGVGKTERGSTKKYLSGSLLSGETTTISKTFGFLDGGGCVSLWYSGNLYDSYCYAAPTQTTEIITKQVIVLDGSVSIESINSKTPESITLRSSLSTTVDLGDKNRYLRTRPSQAGERGSTKKYLEGTLTAGERLIISKTFGFLDKGACVSLWYVDKIYDTYCYTPETQISTGELLTGQFTGIEIPKASIISLLPNPSGKDSSETLIISAHDDYPFTGFFLKVNTSKHKLPFMLSSGENIITGSLGFINKAACVQLWRDTIQLDSFCYTNPKENQRFGQTNEVLQEITQSDFSLISKVKFVVKGNQICTTYQDQILSCRSLPSSKTSIKLKNENKLYKTYTNLLQDYLRKNRSTLFYSTDIKDYFATLSQAKKAVDDFESTIVISGQQIDVQDIATQIALKTATGYVDSGYEKRLPERILWVQKLWRRSTVFWNSVSNFFSISHNPKAVCRGTRCYANATPDLPKCDMTPQSRTNKSDQFCRKQPPKMDSSLTKYAWIWTI